MAYDQSAEICAIMTVVEEVAIDESIPLIPYAVAIVTFDVDLLLNPVARHRYRPCTYAY